MLCVLIFFDDYSSVLITGYSLRSVSTNMNTHTLTLHTHTHVAHTHTHVAHTFTLHTHTTAEADDYSSTIAYTCWNSSELLLYRLWAVLVQAERSLHSLCRVWDLPYPVLCLYPGTLPVVRLNLQFFILSVGVIL